MFQMGSVLRERQSSENKLEAENSVRKSWHMKYTCHVTVLVIVFSRYDLAAFSEMVYASRGCLCKIVYYAITPDLSNST